MNTLRAATALGLASFSSLGGSCSVCACEPPPPSSVLVQPRADTLDVGAVAEFTATPLDRSGNAVPWSAVAWSSSDLTVASVAALRPAAATVAAVGPGRAVILAAVVQDPEVHDSAIVVVRAAVASLLVAPRNDTLSVNDTVLFTATAFYSRGNPIDRSSVTWSAPDSNIVRLYPTSSPGEVLARAVGHGTAAVFAQVDQLRDSGLVRVYDVRAITGTIGFVDVEGGVWVMRGDDGVTYDPIVLPPEFRLDGLRVEATLRIRGDLFSTDMVGVVVEILSIRRS